MTITALRPSGIVIQTPAALTLTGGGTVTSEVNDNSDSTYVKGVSDKNYGRWFLDDITLTGTQRVRSVNVRIRNARDASGGTTQDTLTSVNSSKGAHDGSTIGIGGLASSRGTTAVTTWPGPVCYAGPGGVAWTQTVVNDLQISVVWFKVHYGTAGWQRVHELYVDVDVNEQPTVTGVTVTNYTNNARPNVAFTYGDADSDPQTKYQIRIFDAATYGTGNFSADTSTAVYDTGQVSGDAAALDLDEDLQQGVTFKAYVRAGQAWPGPQGKTWWSAWAVSSAFAITFTAPYTPTVTAMLLSSALNYRTALAVAAPINLLNSDAASFEGGIGGWVASTNGTGPTSVTTDAADGTHSLQLSSTASGTMVYRSPIDAAGQPTVDGGVTYTALVSFHAASAGRSCNAGIRWLDISGAAIGADVYGSNITDVTTAGVYTQAFLTAAAPGNAVKADVLARVQSTGGAAEVHRIDKASLAVGSSTSWTPGPSTVDHVLYLERGERVARRRGPAENWAHPQVASAGSQLQDHGYGFAWPTTTDLLEWTPLDKLIPGGGPYGMLHWQPRNPSGALTSLNLGSSNNYPDTEWNFPVVVGQTHVFSFWAWVGSGTLGSFTPKIEWVDETGTTVGALSSGSLATLTTTPQQISVSAVCPAAAVGAVGHCVNAAGGNTLDIYITRIGWGLGTVPVDDKPASGGPLVWSPVRFQETTASQGLTYAPQQGQARTFNDFEMPPNRPVLYRARIGIQVGGQSIISSNSAYQTLFTTPPTRTQLRSATDPMLVCTVFRSEGAAVGGPSAAFSRSEDAAIFHPLGRDGGPVKVRDWVGGEDGELVAVTTSEKQAQRLDELVKSANVLQIQWQRGGLSYVLITGRSFDEDIYPVAWRDVDDLVVNQYLAYRVWTLSFIETTAP